MISNSNAVTVLCYGDSHTNGQRSDEFEKGRWSAEVRWTGQLQDLLGDGYYVIEEGLGGRTTDLDYPDRVGRNGRTYLVPCLDSHHPLDVVVLMLGTNDVKTQFDRSPIQIATSLGGLIDDIQATVHNSRGGPTKIVVVAPVPIDDQQPMFAEINSANYDATSAAKSRQLAATIRGVARERGVLFADAGVVARVGGDGVHLSRGSHRRIAELVRDMFVEALSGRTPSPTA